MELKFPIEKNKSFNWIGLRVRKEDEKKLNPVAVYNLILIIEL